MTVFFVKSGNDRPDNSRPDAEELNEELMKIEVALLGRR